ncbi:MAG: hypothetical protein RMX96_04325 [Nostoc sp. ChiSLP02]|nr:hypothetical protein [Nostoc sp. ChiSLP02]
MALFKVNTYTTGNQNNSAVAMDADGDFVICWQSDGQDGSGYGIYAQRYNSAGVAQGSEFRVNTYTTSNQFSPTVEMDDSGDFIISWTSYNQNGTGDDIYARRYNSAGVALTNEFKVNTYTTNNQFDPRAAMDYYGNFVISWSSVGEDGSGTGVYAQLYNSSGVAQGSEFKVNTYTTNNQNNSTIAKAGSAGNLLFPGKAMVRTGLAWGYMPNVTTVLG